MQPAMTEANQGSDAVRAFTMGEVLGRSRVLLDALRQAEQVAQTDATVLIHGETGTGKELIAQAIHHWSRRRCARLVKVNAGAIAPTLFESELFGHERGAFTGAVGRRIGRFEAAHDGTLFLDEIGEMPLELQPKLLRLLQEREYERLGGDCTLHSNARLVAATNRDLGAMVAARSFRADLYYRLNVFPIFVPPLRDRREDIPVLARTFVARCARRMGKPVPAISASTMARLSDYGWPGNVRELQNVIERSVILAGGGDLDVQLPARAALATARAVAVSAAVCGSLRDIERAHILSVLESTQWVVGGIQGAAAKLGMKRSTLNFRIKKLGITPQARGDDPPSERECLLRTA